MYIAVVCKGKNLAASGRSNGDWASFINHSKSVAIERALEANERWGGKYTILVGELHEVVRPRREYYLRSLK
jgi:hypothetical protein